MGLHQPEKCRRSHFVVLQQIKRLSCERSTFLLRLSCVPNVGFLMPWVVRVRSCRYPMSALDWSYLASQSEMDLRTVPFLPVSWKWKIGPPYSPYLSRISIEKDVSPVWVESDLHLLEGLFCSSDLVCILASHVWETTELWWMMNDYNLNLKLKLLSEKHAHQNQLVIIH